MTPPDPDDGRVHLMGDGGGYPLSRVFDAGTGNYFSPITPDSQRAAIKARYLLRPSADPARFDAVWPRLWQLTDVEYGDSFGVCAILDSGVLSAHPMLHGCIRQVVDFTGEGGEDSLGHGTMVTLLWRRDMMGIPANRLIVLKCIGADGSGSEANLIHALQWLRSYNADNEPKITDAVLSVGMYNKRFGLFACDGTCKLCTEAVETAKTVRLCVAAGNIAGRTACPAAAAFLPSKPNIAAVTRSDETTAGRGTVTMTSGEADPQQVPFFTFSKRTADS